MKLNVILFVGAAMVAATGVQAQTATLYDGTNLPPQQSTPTSYSFFATSNQSIISFAGYDLPDFITITSPTLMSGSNTTSLNNFILTPAASGSDTEQGDGFFSLGGTTEGSYDTFSTTVTTMKGAQYNLNFGLAVDPGYLGNEESPSSDNGLRITASNASLVGAVPEPATWAMMILGMGMIGAGLRYRRKSMKVSFA